MAVIKIICLADGRATEFDGQYVTEYDPSRTSRSPAGAEMLCHLRTTPDRAKALKLSARDAFELWRKVDERNPVRSDGRPNRPLTAFTVEIT